jgi:hypothetical protein
MKAARNKPDYRKRRVVYDGIETHQYLGGEDQARADRAFDALRARTITAEEFEFYYYLGLEARDMQKRGVE